ncbi:MAG: DUF4364 family protein [Candidatus Howiella sp.]|jgi:hypothetical protein
MEQDAFRAGVRPGGLLNSAQIKILICYILDEIGRPLPRQKLQEVFHYEGLANYFELSQAVSELTKQGNISLCDEERQSYRITDSGREIIQTLGHTLPKTVRDSALRAATTMLVRIKRSENNLVKIEECKTGYQVTCAVLEAGRELMSIMAEVPEISDAERIKNAFLDDPSRVYSGVMGLLIGEEMGYDPEGSEPIL